MIKLDLRDTTGAKVVSLEVVRKHVEARVQFDKCTHLAVLVDPLLSTIACQTCGQPVNPVEWIATLAEYWACVESITEKLQATRTELESTSDALETQRRAKCEHCARITRVRLPSRSQVKRRLNAVS